VSENSLYFNRIKSQELTIIYIKLDDFDFIEDFYDSQLLYDIQENVKEFLYARLIKSHIEVDKLYLLNNGEYVTTLKNLKDIDEINDFLTKLKKFQKSIKEKILKIDDINYQVSIMISVAYAGQKRYESAKLGIKKLLKNNKNFIVANNFSNMAKANTIKNLQVLNTIKEALKNSKVTSFFQPIIDNNTKQITKYESLVRIIEKERVLTPGEFLEIAKKGRYYHKLTKSVLNNSFKVAKLHDMDISINLSVRDMESTLIRKMIYNLLKRYKDCTHKITFELLEDEEIKDLKSISYFINKVKQSGVKIAVDDFGKGFSNFERILCYKPDIIKIDGLLVKDIDKNPYSYSIVKTIVNFAKEQGIQTVAEFVENEKIYECVKNIGVDFSQGFYFGKPQALRN